MKRSSRPLNRTIFLLSICLFLTFSTLATCRHKIQQVPVAIGDIRIIGSVRAGVVQFEPNENPNGDYFIVTKAFILDLARSHARIRLLLLEIERLKKGGK